MKVIGIGECIISDNSKDVLATYALGSCVGICVYCRRKKIMALAHVALPDSGLSSVPCSFRECHFADTTVPFLIQKMTNEYGCTRGDLEIKLYGGARAKSSDVFNIGPRNVEAVKAELDKLMLKYDDSSTGGHVSRTIKANVADGEVDVYSQNMLI